MIFHISKGRLGNELFQLAVIKSISKRNESIVVFNMNSAPKVVETGNLKIRFLNLHVLIEAFYFRIINPLILVLSHLRILGYVSENKKSTDAQKLNVIKGLLPITIIESDYYNSEEYFNKEIEFQIKKECIRNAQTIMDSLPSDATKVFIHVRRGDYLFVPTKTNIGVNLNHMYYRKAISTMESTIKDPFYIFLTDDSEYVELAFSDIENKFISKESAETDFAIMTLCQYGIISNSTFSWWGARFKARNNKVIFPKYWFGWKEKELSHPGIYPDWSTIIDPNSELENQ